MDGGQPPGGPAAHGDLRHQPGAGRALGHAAFRGPPAPRRRVHGHRLRVPQAARPAAGRASISSPRCSSPAAVSTTRSSGRSPAIRRSSRASARCARRRSGARSTRRPAGRCSSRPCSRGFPDVTIFPAEWFYPSTPGDARGRGRGAPLRAQLEGRGGLAADRAARRAAPGQGARGAREDQATRRVAAGRRRRAQGEAQEGQGQGPEAPPRSRRPPSRARAGSPSCARARDLRGRRQAARDRAERSARAGARRVRGPARCGSSSSCAASSTAASSRTSCGCCSPAATSCTWCSRWRSAGSPTRRGCSTSSSAAVPGLLVRAARAARQHVGPGRRRSAALPRLPALPRARVRGRGAPAPARQGARAGPAARRCSRSPSAARAGRRALGGFIRAIEAALPIPKRLVELVESRSPDVVLVSPLIGLGSIETDHLRAAQAAGVPTVLPVASWDNLSNKGVLRDLPTLTIVWNGIQVDEAVRMHNVPGEQRRRRRRAQLRPLVQRPAEHEPRGVRRAPRHRPGPSADPLPRARRSSSPATRRSSSASGSLVSASIRGCATPPWCCVRIRTTSSAGPSSTSRSRGSPRCGRAPAPSPTTRRARPSSSTTSTTRAPSSASTPRR